MLHDFVLQGRDFLVGGVITAIALAGFVGIPAFFKAGRRFGFVMLDVVGVRVGIAVRTIADITIGR